MITWAYNKSNKDIINLDTDCFAIEDQFEVIYMIHQQKEKIKTLVIYNVRFNQINFQLEDIIRLNIPTTIIANYECYAPHLVKKEIVF